MKGMNELGDTPQSQARWLLQRGQDMDKSSVLKVRTFDMTLKRRVWSLEQSPGASLGWMGKLEQANHEPQKHFSWDVF